MNAETNPNSITSLLRDLRDDTTTLLRQEVALAKTEMKENVSRATSHALHIAIGGFVAYAGIIVLLIGIGRATRLLSYAADRRKTYRGTIRLGQSTITDDAEGEVTAAVDAGHLGEAHVAGGLAAFRGEIMQVPSAVSAIKVKGVRSYARVRRGEEVALAARPVTVHRLELLAVRPGGCSGFSYEMFFDTDVAEDDQTADYSGVKVVVDSSSAMLLEGATLDYKDGLQGAGFAIDNPNAQRTCGCGQSFS